MEVVRSRGSAVELRSTGQLLPRFQGRAVWLLPRLTSALTAYESIGIIQRKKVITTTPAATTAISRSESATRPATANPSEPIMQTRNVRDTTFEMSCISCLAGLFYKGNNAPNDDNLGQRKGKRNTAKSALRPPVLPFGDHWLRALRDGMEYPSRCG